MIAFPLIWDCNHLERGRERERGERERERERERGREREEREEERGHLNNWPNSLSKR